jgi:hypothetical protein
MATNAMSLVPIFKLFTSPLRDLFCGTGGRFHLPAFGKEESDCLKTFR